jgi:hypothetical protein
VLGAMSFLPSAVMTSGSLAGLMLLASPAAASSSPPSGVSTSSHR